VLSRIGCAGSKLVLGLPFDDLVQDAHHEAGPHAGECHQGGDHQKGHPEGGGNQGCAGHQKCGGNQECAGEDRCPQGGRTEAPCTESRRPQRILRELRRNDGPA